jgi:2-methylcitrate dehydratase PrpD
VTPDIYNLVGHQFEIGANPRVNAQFNIQYCVANALLRKSSKLNHFEESYIREPKITELIKTIRVTADPTLSEGKPEFHCKADFKLTTKKGSIYHEIVDIPSGFPGNPLTDAGHMERFQDYVSYGGKSLTKENVGKLVDMINSLEEVEDVRSFIPLLISHD